MTWLEDLLLATDDAETPKSFILFSGFCAISAVVKNNVWFNKRLYNVYPNIYVLIVAKSGLGKSFATNLASKLVNLVGNTRVITGRNSIQAILQDLSRPHNINGKTISDSCAFLSSNELSNLVIEDPAAMSILRELYDSNYNAGITWTNSLKSSGKEKLKDICVSLLGATNPEDFRDKMTAKDIKGGFIARCFIISDSVKNRLNDLLDEPEHPLDKDKLSEHLKVLSFLKGEMIFTTDAKGRYREWYKDYYTDSEGREDKTGSSERLRDHIIKLGMLISLSRGTDLIISLDDVEQAIELCLQLNANVDRFTIGTGKSAMGPQSARVLEVIVESPGSAIGRQKLLQKLYGDVDHFELDRIMETLDNAGIATLVRVGKDLIYKITPGFLAKYNRWKEGKRSQVR